MTDNSLAKKPKRPKFRDDFGFRIPRASQNRPPTIVEDDVTDYVFNGQLPFLQIGCEHLGFQEIGSRKIFTAINRGYCFVRHLGE